MGMELDRIVEMVEKPPLDLLFLSGILADYPRKVHPDTQQGILRETSPRLNHHDSDAAVLTV